MWDVVNEALNDDGTLRETVFLEMMGDNYIEKAFQYANDTDALNIAFDITPGQYVSKFITELGIHNTDKDSIDELYNTLAH